MENYSEAKPTLDINKVCSELTKRKLLEVIEMRLNSNNFKLCVEPGSRKGTIIELILIMYEKNPKYCIFKFF